MTDNPAPAVEELIHANCVVIGDYAALLIGPSGSGKSDLSLRLIDRGAILVSDDYTRLHLDEATGSVIARPPETIAGRMEVRGLGILAMPYREQAPVALVVALVAEGEPAVERLPMAQRSHSLCGRTIPLVRLNAMEASVPIKLEYALRASIGLYPATEMQP
ncbi:MAG: aldolase [Sphingomonadales bacterium]|nr:MAG: aldolase [Sphingomonadales bacterium]TNF04100.1 MAG: aldolase [Sphingomonadales bacterium]